MVNSIFSNSIQPNYFPFNISLPTPICSLNLQCYILKQLGQTQFLMKNPRNIKIAWITKSLSCITEAKEEPINLCQLALLISNFCLTKAYQLEKQPVIVRRFREMKNLLLRLILCQNNESFLLWKMLCITPHVNLPNSPAIIFSLCCDFHCCSKEPI